ncbi:MAG: multicopper oxidase domain-containing protein [Crocinitomicaceae bacterium]|nr:multicopper oxidase domain-containing protein [Crocinitomicaceae bacterium]
MKKLSILLFLITAQQVYAQIDYTKLIIGRNTGTKTLHDGNVTNIFGFAESLGELIDIPGTTIYLNEGDSVDIDFWNVSQGAPHTIHLHGLDVNQENDGVPSLSFEVHHMDHGHYKFKAPHAGTYLYHCHVVSSVHVQAGMYGAIIVRPPNGDANQTWENGETYDREFIFTTSEIDTNWHVDSILEHEHDTLNPVPMFVPEDYAPQYFLVEGLSDSQLADPANFQWAAENAKVYLREINIGYYGVRYIYPTSVSARTISSDGRPLPAEYVNDTLEIYPGERYGTMIQLGTDPFYLIDVEYFNLNTGVVESTQTVTIRTSAVGLEENTSSTFTVYPVPSSTGVFYSSNDFESDYKVFSITGNLVLENDSKMIDLSTQPEGVYILHYNGQAKKLIIE